MNTRQLNLSFNPLLKQDPTKVHNAIGRGMRRGPKNGANAFGQARSAWARSGREGPPPQKVDYIKNLESNIVRKMTV